MSLGHELVGGLAYVGISTALFTKWWFQGSIYSHVYEMIIRKAVIKVYANIILDPFSIQNAVATVWLLRKCNWRNEKEKLSFGIQGEKVINKIIIKRKWVG